MQAAHTCRREDEMPNDLLPNNNRAGTVNPISGPAIYQGQGCKMEVIIAQLYIFPNCPRGHLKFCKNKDSDLPQFATFVTIKFFKKMKIQKTFLSLAIEKTV